MTAPAVVLPASLLLIDGAMPVTALLERPAFARVGRAVVVDERGAALGIVSITDLQRHMRARELEPAAQRLAA